MIHRVHGEVYITVSAAHSTYIQSTPHQEIGTSLCQRYWRAVMMTRGIKEIPQFEILLHEYENISWHTSSYEKAKVNIINGNFAAKEENSTHNVNRAGWHPAKQLSNNDNKPKYRRQGHKYEPWETAQANRTVINNEVRSKMVHQQATSYKIKWRQWLQSYWFDIYRFGVKIYKKRIHLTSSLGNILINVQK